MWFLIIGINEKKKLDRMHEICRDLEVSMSEIAYIGDDINDLPLLQQVGLSAMPPNSPILDSFSPDYLTTKYGGQGAFREFVDTILEPNPFNDFINFLIK